MSVIVGRPPKSAAIVGVLVDLDLSIDAVAATERIGEAAESLRSAGLALVLLPADVEVQTTRRPWWRPNGKGTRN